MTTPASRIEFSRKALAEQDKGSQPLALTSVRAGWTWILYGVTTVVCAALIVWGFFGSVVDSVTGQGILMLHGGVHAVTTRSSGTLTQLNVSQGMPVHSGQVIGEIYNAETMFRIRRLEQEYEQLARQSKLLTEGSREMTTLRLKMEKERETALAALTQEYHASLARSQLRSQNFQAMRKERAISLGDYFAALDAMLNTEAQLLSNRLEVMRSTAQMHEVDWEQRKNLIELENALLLKTLEVEMARKLYVDAFRLTSDFDGRIQELRKNPGDFVQAGETIALIAARESDGLTLTGFFTPADGKKMKPGMSAYFAPASARPEEYGYILGVVREVSEAPISPEAVLAELHNAGLAQSLTGGGAAIRVVVELVPDETTRSGLRWTSSKGAPVQLSSGTTGTLMVNTEYRRPASFLVPYARQALFGE